MTKEELAILTTFSYVELFDYPLTASEILAYYVSDSPLARGDLETALARLIDQGVIFRDPLLGLHSFPDKVYIIERRLERAVSSSKLMKKARWVARCLSFFPGVRLVAVTGSLASLNSTADDDIDLMVITTHGRLWLTRALVFGVLKALKLKRGDRQVPGGAVCINVWMEEGDLLMGNKDQDLVIAFDVARAQVLLDKGGLWEKMIRANSWVFDLLPGFLSRLSAAPSLTKLLPTWLVPLLPIRALVGWILDRLETVFYKAQLAIIKRKFPNNPYIKVGPHRLWQHPTNTRGKILLRFEENRHQRLGSPVTVGGLLTTEASFV